MSDAPERIWLDLERIPSRHTCSPSEATPHDVKYIRADLSDALLREAVAVLERCPPTSNPTLSAEYHLERINAWWRLDVYPALAKIKGADHD